MIRTITATTDRPANLQPPLATETRAEVGP